MNTPARPLTVVQMLPELQSGGVERGTLELAAFLVSQGHRSLVISGGGRLAPELAASGSRHLAWQIGAKSPLTLRYVPRLVQLFFREQVDILHLRSRVPAWVGYLAWRLTPAARRPRLVTTFHGFYSVNGYSAVMAKGERVIAISRVVREHILANYPIPPERVVLIPRGVDEKIFTPEAVAPERMERLRAQWGLSAATGPVIMLPGRITRLKGHEIFIRSLAVLQNLPWTALIVGDPEDNPRLADELRALIAASRLEKRILLAGHCPDMPAAYALAGLVVSATHGTPEAFGRVAVEAQAMGVPVVASALGGSLETVLPGKTGWLFAPGDAEDLTRALREALPNRGLREAYGRAGRDWVRENFTVARMCRETLSVYHSFFP